jgi:Flp pilus assembly protein TadB
MSRNSTTTRFDPKSSRKQERDNTSGAEGRRHAQQERSKTMPLIQLLEVLIVVGVLLWLVNRFIPMQSSIKSILNGVVVIAVVLWLLNVFGLFHSLSHIRVGKG